MSLPFSECNSICCCLKKRQNFNLFFSPSFYFFIHLKILNYSGVKILLHLLSNSTPSPRINTLLKLVVILSVVCVCECKLLCFKNKVFLCTLLINLLLSVTVEQPKQATLSSMVATNHIQMLTLEMWLLQH